MERVGIKTESKMSSVIGYTKRLMVWNRSKNVSFNFEHWCSCNRRCSFQDREWWEHKTTKSKQPTQEKIETAFSRKD